VDVVRPPALSFLVAFRDVDGTRTRLWDLIRAKLETSFPDAEIVVGTDDGTDPFHKTLALNRAAAASSGSILAIWDTDTWIDERLVTDAVQQVAADPRIWCRPYCDKLKMNAAATDAVLAQGVAWDGTPPTGFGKPEWRTTYRYAPPFVVSRILWDTVGGMCERFRGWGQEDEAFALAAERLFGAAPRPSRPRDRGPSVPRAHRSIRLRPVGRPDARTHRSEQAHSSPATGRPERPSR
jgi:hypothetical protein